MNCKRILSALLLCAVLLCCTGCGEEAEIYTHEDLVFGTIETTNTTCTYTSVTGIACTLDPQWKLVVGDQLNDLTGTIVNMDDPVSVSRALNLGRPVYELYALGNTGASLSVSVEDMRVILGEPVSAEAYGQCIEKPSRQRLQILGVQNLELTLGTVDFAGAQHPAILTTGDLMNAKFYETHVFLTQGNYVYTVTVTCYNKDIRTETLAYFTAV